MSVEQAQDSYSQNHAKKNSLEQGPSRIYLVTDGLRSKYTKANYRLAFNQFLRDGAKTTDLRVLLDYKPRVIEQMVIGYVENLRDKGRAHKTIQLHVAAILHFFVTLNDIPLNKKKIIRFIPPDESSQRDRPYTIDEVKAILDSSPDERTKVIVLLMASTAMRIGAISGLVFRDLTPIPDYNLYKIQVYADSRKDSYICFCSSECARAIDAYLDYRRRLGENIGPKSPLIRELFNVKKPFFVQAPKHSTERMLYLALEKALSNAGVNQRIPGLLQKGKRREIMPSHGLRKAAISAMVAVGVKDTHRRYLSGHAQIGQDAHYVLPTENDLLSEYLKAIPLVTTDPTQRLQQKVNELESERSKELEAMKAQLMEYKQFADKTAAEISELKARKDLHGWGSSLYFVDPNFSNLVDAVNELRVKNGLDSLTTITRENKAAKAKRIRDEIYKLQTDKRENEHPDYDEVKIERIKELEQELKECLL